VFVEDGAAVVVVVSAGVVVVSVLAVVAAAVLVVVDVVVAVVGVGALVVGSLVVGGSSARAAAAAPLPKRTTVASVAVSFWRAMGRDYRRLSNVLLYKRSGVRTIAPPQLPTRPRDRLSIGCRSADRRGSNYDFGEEAGASGALEKGAALRSLRRCGDNRAR
jgi:hypothetical protein